MRNEGKPAVKVGAPSFLISSFIFLILLLSQLLFTSCSLSDRQAVDKLNSLSYAYHYRNLDSTEYYARQALQQASADSLSWLYSSYKDGCAEALNHLAFVSIMRMDYDEAKQFLDRVASTTDNQVELLIADIQQMRLCQRQSHNREFYDYREQAYNRLMRINEERPSLSERLQQRMVYAESELAIVQSTYYYYVGLERQSIEAIEQLYQNVDIERDTAQMLNYFYNVGAGGIITEGTQVEINQQEFDFLMRCLLLARQSGYPYFEANSLEALSEHLMYQDSRQQLIENNLPAMKFLNPEGISDDILAVCLAEQALDIFMHYGDVYQIAGAHRTLASCYHAMDDDAAALEYLHLALSNKKIEQAPDLVASIREQLSVAYSALDDKVASDLNRNIYLDLQQQTRQDLYLQARADMYDHTARQQNIMMIVVVCAIILLVFMLWLFNHLHKKRSNSNSMDELLRPLREWQQQNEQQVLELEEQVEDINEQHALSMLHIEKNERRNLENRAKVSLVNTIMPFIDRIIHEVKSLEEEQTADHKDTQSSRSQERLQYIRELTDKINEQNDVLTHWIQLRQGELSLRIESFPIQQLFDVVARGKMSFHLKGIELQVLPTDAVVKADRILTLFMLNTLADNARKFTEKGGQVTISATSADNYVEVSVADTGIGMTEDQLAHLFDHKAIIDDKSQGRNTAMQTSHGFGLMNCRGIIEKYRKISHIFSVCMLAAESEQGRGSRLFFRLPIGKVLAAGLLLLTLCLNVNGQQATDNRPLGLPLATVGTQEPTVLNGSPAENDPLARAYIFSDSAYFSNINGTYERTLMFADSCRYYLNAFYRQQRPHGQTFMLREGDTSLPVPEIQWLHDSIQTNYDIILDIRNECAVAALALHQWPLYAYNNKVYTQLFKELSADDSLDVYCRMMQQSQTNRTIAIIILVLILAVILPAYYLLYYRHRLNYRFCVERIGTINDILLSDIPAAEKLERIAPLASADYPDELQTVVSEIRQALQASVSKHEQQVTNIEMAEDELRRAELENNNLHVANSILDNCLSTLKHETMYYPSRIRQLIDSPEVDVKSVKEVVTYYRDIYSLLSQQLTANCQQLKANHLTAVNLYGQTVLGDKTLLRYLFEILTRQKENISAEVKDDKYVLFTVRLPQLHLTDEEAQNLFAPAENHIPYLLCRQIVRDHSEATNRRACGIRAEVINNTTQVIITLPRQKSIKSKIRKS